MGKFERLNDDALLLLVVSELSVSSQGEVLAQRVAIETIIGHNTTQIRMSSEEYTEHVVDLTLVPQGAFKQTGQTGHGAGLIGVGLDSDAGVVTNAKKVVDDFETLVTGWVVDGGDIGDGGEFSRGMVFEKAHNRDDAGRRNVDAKLVLPHGELLDMLGQAGHDVLAVVVQAIGLVLVLVGLVYDGSAKRARGCTKIVSELEPHTQK